MKERISPWTNWDRFYDPRPVPFPRRCICCKTIVKDERESARHSADCICVTNLRTVPLYLDSDRWERIPGVKYPPEPEWRAYDPAIDTNVEVETCQCEECQGLEDG